MMLTFQRDHESSAIQISTSEHYTLDFLHQIIGFCALTALSTAQEMGDKKTEEDCGKILELIGFKQITLQ